MHSFIVLSIIKVLVYSKTCNEISPKVINTYVVSDSTILCNEGSVFNPSVEVFDNRWLVIPNAFWIWKTSTFSKAQSFSYFSSSFSVPGKIIDGNFEFCVDNYLNALSFNDKVVSLNTRGVYNVSTTVKIGNFIQSGLNYFNATVENKSGGSTNPGGISFKITITSEVWV